MKVMKHMISAICLGIFAGLFVSVLSYYNNHKEGGLIDTMLAVADSARTVRQAYSGSGADMYDWNVDSNLLAGGELTSDAGEYIDATIPALSDSVLAAFSDISGYSSRGGISEIIGNVFQRNNKDSDLLAINNNIDVDEPYSDILRFHVRANSDSEKDQELKMAVKEDVVALLKPLLADCNSVVESKEVVISNMQNIYTTAVNTLTEQGCNYPVKVYVTTEEFPAKTYGDLTFPEGKYQALRIDIGNALGQNWWCVMYPPLCFIDDTTTIVSDEGKEILRDNLSQEEYEALFNDPKTEIKGELMLYNKLYEWLK